MASPKPRVFLDSNVIFSGLYSSQGVPGIILEHFVNGDIRVVVSQQVLEEIVRTIKEKLPGALPALRTLLVNASTEVIADPELNDIERWIGRMPVADAAILVAAVSAQPDYSVTGDNHFMEDSSIVGESGLRILTPAKFLKLIEL